MMTGNNSCASLSGASLPRTKAPMRSGVGCRPNVVLGWPIYLDQRRRAAAQRMQAPMRPDAE